MLKFRFIVFVLILTFSITIAQTPRGTIKGKVTDFNSKKELIGANVLISGTAMGASTNENGKFVISNVRVGSHTVRFSYIGYETIMKTDIVVRPGRITFINAELKSSGIKKIKRHLRYCNCNSKR